MPTRNRSVDHCNLAPTAAPVYGGRGDPRIVVEPIYAGDGRGLFAAEKEDTTAPLQKHDLGNQEKRPFFGRIRGPIEMRVGH